MKTLTKILGVLLLLATTVFAQQPGTRTYINVREPLLVAGFPQVTLQPGRYIMRVVNHDHNRNIVQIFTENERLVTTALAINNYRLRPTNDTVLQYWETPTGNPPALRAWFQPGEEWGQEFVYPKGLATRLAQQTGGPVPTTTASTEAELRTAPVTEMTRTGEEKPLEEAYQEPATAQARTQEAARAQAPAAAAAGGAQAGRPQAPAKGAEIAQAPAAQAPATQAPATQAPATQAPAAKAPAGQAQAPAAPAAVAEAPAGARGKAPVEVAAAQAPGRPDVAAQPAAPAQAPLPATGTPVYTIALAGLLAAGAGYALRRTAANRG